MSLWMERLQTEKLEDSKKNRTEKKGIEAHRMHHCMRLWKDGV